jgi:TolB-like protein
MTPVAPGDGGLVDFWGELRRRKVVRVAGVYTIAAWLIAQAAALLEGALGLPTWFDGVVVVALMLGLPVALIFAWAFELTPDGVKRTAPRAEGDPVPKFAVADIALLGAIVVLVAVSAFQIAGRGQAPTSPSAVSAESADRLSIAVLPFVNMSSDPEQEYFSDGLSEELLNQLAQIDALTVIGRTSSFAFKGRNEDLRAIGEQLGAANLLEGSVRKSGDRLRITAQLIDAASGAHLWSDTYDRQLTDVFAIQDEIALAVAEALSVTLGVSRPHVAEPESVEVYDLYLRGLAVLREESGSFTAEDVLTAADIFEGVIELDPDFSRARVALAGLYAAILSLFPERAEQSLAELEAAVNDALAHAPDDPASHYVSAVLHTLRQEWLEADAAFARSGDLANGALGEVSTRDTMLLSVGRASEAADRLMATARNNPLSQVLTNWLQMTLTASERFEEAEAEYRRANALGMTTPPIEHVALMRAWVGDDDVLVAARFDRYIEIQSVTSALNVAVRAVYDDPETALAVVRAFADRPEMQDPVRQFFVADFAAHYGDPELALAAMRRSLIDLHGTLSNTLWFPDFAAMRALPSFKDLVREIGLLDYWRTTGEWGDYCRPVGDDDFECR